MKASSLFFFGFLVMWFIASLPEIISGEYDGIFSAGYEWDTTKTWSFIGIFIVLFIIWNRFDNWLNGRYIVFKRNDEGILWNQNA